MKVWTMMTDDRSAGWDCYAFLSEEECDKAVQEWVDVEWDDDWTKDIGPKPEDPWDAINALREHDCQNYIRVEEHDLPLQIDIDIKGGLVRRVEANGQAVGADIRDYDTSTYDDDDDLETDEHGETYIARGVA